MCTAIKLKYKDNYIFGRNLDLDYHFNEKLILLNKNYKFTFKFLSEQKSNYNMMGIGALVNNYPLFSEAMNEKGLCIAGLNYPQNAYYFNDIDKNKINLAPYELIIYLLNNCSNIKEVKEVCKNIQLINKPFLDNMPLSYLHFLISDKDGSIVLEPDKDGLKIYDNTFEVLTNNPPFTYHLENIKLYLNLTNKYYSNNFNTNYELKPFCIGSNATGLPGDSSSPSRFIRSVYLKENLLKNITDKDNLINELFHIFSKVSVIKGEALTSDNKSEITIYTSILDPKNMTYYIKTYDKLDCFVYKFDDYLSKFSDILALNFN